MIDTIILKLPRSKVTIVNASGISPWNLQASTRAYRKYIKNPTTRDEKSGLYFPRLTGFKRRVADGFDSTIKIEFSAPKLIYKNNVDELSDTQFDLVLDALRDRLHRMGVIISAKDLANAEVRAVHYSKNIELRDGYTSRYVIGEIGKTNLDQRLDMTKARYMNEGQSLYAYSVSNSLVLYDKVADLNRGQKRSIDKDQMDYQLSLLDQLKKGNEILRFEVRLSQARKMISLFKKLGFPETSTFRSIYSSKKSATVLMHYWNTLVSKNGLPLFAHSFTPTNLCRQILLTQKNAKRKKAIYLTGLLLLSQDNGGMRELREILSSHVHDRTWYRVVRDLRILTSSLGNLRPRGWFEQVEAVLQTNRPYRIESSKHDVL